MNHCRVTATTLGCDHTPGGAILFPGVLLDIVHPEWRLLVIAEAQLAPEHVEDVLVLHHGVALQTAGARASATDPLPDIGVCKRVLSYHYHYHYHYHYQILVSARECYLIIIGAESGFITSLFSFASRLSHNHIPDTKDLSRLRTPLKAG